LNREELNMGGILGRKNQGDRGKGQRTESTQMKLTMTYVNMVAGKALTSRWRTLFLDQLIVNPKQ
jgi:hypothetical protein